MLSGYDMKIVAVCVEGCEVLCLSCASKRLGEPRAARVIAGLECLSTWGAPHAESQASIDDGATDNGYECKCSRELPADEFCSDCAEECCFDCGVRLDIPAEETASPASSV